METTQKAPYEQMEEASDDVQAEVHKLSAMEMGDLAKAYPLASAEAKAIFAAGIKLMYPSIVEVCKVYEAILADVPVE